MSLRLSVVILLLIAIGVAADDENTDFLLNVFSDIGPVLALFGEQFARQFLSETFTWYDHLIFACVPLGIMTAIAGAIRVQGHKYLKAFIGRARENRSAAEIEYMSSTSGEVCELFNGKGIIRTMGRSDIAQLIIFPDKFPKLSEVLMDASCGIHTLQSAAGESVLTNEEYRDEFDMGLLKWLKSFKPRSPSSGLAPGDVENGGNGNNVTGSNTENTAQSTTTNTRQLKDKISPKHWDSLKYPNLQLNITTENISTERRSVELRLAALTAVILQASLLVIAGVVTYRISGFSPQPWGLPCYIGGSILLFIGMLACSVAIERSTVEFKWQPTAAKDLADNTEDQLLAPATNPSVSPMKKLHNVNRPMSLFWIQRTQRVSDQDFGSYVIYVRQKDHISTSSRWEDVYTKEMNGNEREETPKTHHHDSNNRFNINSLSKRGTANSDTDDRSRRSELLALTAILAGGAGFTIQFIGLRGLPWPCAVSQLGAIILMAIIRALIRRRLGEVPLNCQAPTGYELDFLAIRLVESGYKMFQTPTSEMRSPQDVLAWRVDTAKQSQAGTCPFPFPSLHLSGTGGSNSLEANKPNKAQQLVLIRKRLGDLCQWTSSASKPAFALARSIERFMDEFQTSRLPSQGSNIPWRISFRSPDNEPMSVKLSITKEEANGASQWVKVGQVEAILSLWMANLETTNTARVKESKDVDWQRSKARVTSKVDYCRILGHSDERGVLERDIKWWVSNPAITETTIESNANGASSENLPHSNIKTVIGFTGPSQDKVHHETSKLLVQHSTADLATIAAQHLFTSFIWTVIEHLPKDFLDQGAVNIHEFVKVQTSRTFDLQSRSKVGAGRKLSHTKLTRFALHAEKEGLGTLDDILLCLIPAFSFNDVLPNDAILKFDQPKSKIQEARKQWAQGSLGYIRFLEWLTRHHGFDTDDYLSLAAVMDTMEFVYLMGLDLDNTEYKQSPTHDEDSDADSKSFRSEGNGSGNSAIESEDSESDSTPGSDINSEISNWEPQDVENHQERDDNKTIIRKQTHSANLDELLKYLSRTFPNVIKKLAPFYELQKRIESFQKVFGRCCEINNDELWSPEVKEDQEFMRQIGFTDLHRKVSKASEEREVTIGQLFVKDGKKRDIFGWTPLHYAATRQDLALAKGCQQNCQNKDCDQSCVATFLQDNRPEHWWLDNFRQSPVHIAASFGNAEFLQTLLETLSQTLSERDAKLAAQSGRLDGARPLHLAVEGDHVSCVELLLKVESMPSDDQAELDAWKRSPIHTAVAKQSYSCANQLLESKDFNFNPDAPDVFEKTLFSYLDYKNSEERSIGAVLLLKHCEKFKASDLEGQTILHRAINFLTPEQLKQLLMGPHTQSQQLDVEAENNFGQRPLHLAVSSRDEGLVRVLIDCNASASAQDHDKISPVMLACDLAQKAMIWYILLWRKYTGTETDTKGRTALHHAIMSEEWQGDDCHFIVERFARAMKNIDVRDHDGCTPLHYAAVRSKVSIFTALLNSRANIKVVDENDRNVLHYAVIPKQKRGKTPSTVLMERILKDMPESVNLPDKDGKTPLHLALEQGDDRTAVLLFSKQANLHIKNSSGMPPLIVAIQGRGCPRFIENVVKLSNHPGEESGVEKESLKPDLGKAASEPNSDEEALEKVVTSPHSRFNINQEDSRFGQSPLAWACELGQVEAVKILLSATTLELNRQSASYEGFTPLHFALEADEKEIVRLLLNDSRIIPSLSIASHNGIKVPELAINDSSKDCLMELLLHPNAGPGIFSASDMEQLSQKYPESDIQAFAWNGWEKAMLDPSNRVKFPLHKLAEAGRCQRIESIFQTNTHFPELDEDGWTLADVAGRHGHIELKEYLQHNQPRTTQPQYREPSTFVNLSKNIELQKSFCSIHDPCLGAVLDAKAPSLDLTQGHLFILRTHEAIPPDRQWFYFEVNILHLPESKVFATGFCRSNVPKNRLPGWDSGSWAYHSDNGGLYVEASCSITESDEHVCHEGDVMGCGLNLITGKGYRTLNGIALDSRNAFKGHEFLKGKLYPCIGFRVASGGDGFQVHVTLQASDE